MTDNILDRIREMTEDDWPDVKRIYSQSLEKGTASFTKDCPSKEEWDAGHHKKCRFVYEAQGDVAGFAAISPTSTKQHYSGVVEVSVYVDEKHLRRGIGTALLNKLREECRKCGYWTLYSSIFSDNIASIELHKKCGFRVIGYREKIAKNIFGSWKSTVIMELRNDIE